jgi:aminopeptidase N
MKRLLIILFFSIQIISLKAQDSTQSPANPALLIYRASFPHINDLQHTKLDVRFDYAKSYLYGKAWITLRPHFYPTDSLSLDAKGMDIKEVSILKGNQHSPLKYNYDGSTLRIHLDKTYRYSENYTIYIDYTSKPNELKVQGSEAIKDAKGLYFINPLGEDKNEPTQIWTQGETESNSAWFPTIDKPDQKCTDEISMTVPAKYVTLSNGKLVSQVKNANGTRTDTWKMDLPHSPYLVFMGIGDYAVIHDSYKGKDVNYYVEKEYGPVARKIFGLTPEMMAFYSRILDFEYPWVKYSQMTGRDYVSGAMENTTATLHTDALQQDARQLTDGNKYEDYICHELFHQWFGDLVTTESWSNLTLNESFANFSETLWFEYKHGKDAGDATNYHDIEKYLAGPGNPSKDLVRFYYADREDMFDMVTYSKGGRILNMLRNYVGDSAFFKALNLYLVSFKFKNAEAHNLRLAFEQVTGQDLNWYWNQWYYGSGHPIFDISYRYDDSKKMALVIVNQVQNTGKIFRIPMAIDVYEGGSKSRHKVWLENESDSFYFRYNKRPDLINVDGDKIVLCQKQDHKTLDNFIYQYTHAGLYLDRREAIEYCAAHQDEPAARGLLKMSLKDRYFELRNMTMNLTDYEKPGVKTDVEPVLLDLATRDPDRTVQGNAIGLLGTYKKEEYKNLFLKKTSDSSYTVSGNALAALSILDEPKAFELAKEFSNHPAKGDLFYAMASLLIMEGEDAKFDMIISSFNGLPMSEEKIQEAPQLFAALIMKTQNKELVKKAVDALVRFRDDVPSSEKAEMNTLINNNYLKPVAEQKEKEGLKEQGDYIRSAIK